MLERAAQTLCQNARLLSGAQEPDGLEYLFEPITFVGKGRLTHVFPKAPTNFVAASTEAGY